MDERNNTQTNGIAQRKKMQTACFTGHRRIDGAELPLLKQRLDKTIANLISKGVIFYGVGGAIGFDTLAAQAVLGARESNPRVKLIMVLPCRDQDSKWSDADKKEYRRLLETADKVVCLSEHFFNGCMEQRNLHLIQHSSICVSFMKRGHSGTSQTVRFAQEHGLTIINLAEN